MKIKWKEIIITIITFLVVFIVVQFSIRSYKVEQTSMIPTIQPGNSLVVDKLTYRFRSPHRGEIVVLWPPQAYRQKDPFIKRIIGLPGETVNIDANGRVSIEAKGGSEFRALVEQPTMPACSVRNKTWTLGEDEYFVLGDNRDFSEDSSIFGPVKGKDITGKTWLRYWPLSKFGLTPHYSYSLEAPTASTSTSFGSLSAEPTTLMASTDLP